MNPSSSYDKTWFEARAKSALKQIAPHTWDYSDSVLLYLPTADERYEHIQRADDPYSELFTKPETAFLKEIAHEVVAALPASFDFIDLGPGTAQKEQYIFDAARAAGKQITYIPVDISQRYLEIAEERARAQGIATIPIRASFEEIPERLKTRNSFHRFVSIGATFTNYHPEEIFALLKSIAGPNGTIFIDAQMRDRVDMNKVMAVYRDISGIVFPKLELIGLAPSDVTQPQADDGVRIWTELKRSNPLLESISIRAGDRLLVLQSLRYTKEELRRTIALTFPKSTILDHDRAFVGALLFTK